MSLTSTFLFASLLLTSACGKSEPEPFKGPLTLKQLVTEDFGEKNASAVKLCDEPWDAALARLQSRLGPPTKVAGDKYTWAVHEAESCATTSFSRDPMSFPRATARATTIASRSRRSARDHRPGADFTLLGVNGC